MDNSNQSNQTSHSSGLEESFQQPSITENNANKQSQWDQVR